MTRAAGSAGLRHKAAARSWRLEHRGAVLLHHKNFMPKQTIRPFLSPLTLSHRPILYRPNSFLQSFSFSSIFARHLPTKPATMSGEITHPTIKGITAPTITTLFHWCLGVQLLARLSLS